MTDKEIEQIYSKMQERWGDKLPDPDVFPASFSFYLKLYQYLEKNNIL